MIEYVNRPRQVREPFRTYILMTASKCDDCPVLAQDDVFKSTKEPFLARLFQLPASSSLSVVTGLWRKRYLTARPVCAIRVGICTLSALSLCRSL